VRILKVCHSSFSFPIAESCWFRACWASDFARLRIFTLGKWWIWCLHRLSWRAISFDIPLLDSNICVRIVIGLWIDIVLATAVRTPTETYFWVDEGRISLGTEARAQNVGPAQIYERLHNGTSSRFPIDRYAQRVWMNPIYLQTSRLLK
jgi:hypothetical protein